MTAQPDHANFFHDFRLHQDGGCHIGDRADGDHIQQLPFGHGHGLFHQVARRFGLHRRLAIGQIAAGPFEHKPFACPAHLAQQPHDFRVAFFHAVFRAAGTVVKIGRGIYCEHIQFLRRKEAVSQRELVVHLVIRIGVQHHFHPAFGRLQAAHQFIGRKQIPFHINHSPLTSGYPSV